VQADCRGIEDRLLRLRPDAVHGAQATFLRSPMQILQCPDAERLVQRACALCTDPRDLQQLGDGRRQLGAQLVQQDAVSGTHDFADLACKIGTDPRQRIEVRAAVDHGLDVRSEFAQHVRRIAVGTHAEAVGALHLEQIGDLLKEPCDVG